jgi:vitamin K-dependent gamma-carboxylase
MGGARRTRDGARRTGLGACQGTLSRGTPTASSSAAENALPDLTHFMARSPFRSACAGWLDPWWALRGRGGVAPAPPSLDELGDEDLSWLVVLRVVAGASVAVMAVALLVGVPPLDRYLDAPLHYPYRGLEWIRPLTPAGLRALALALVASGAAMAAGYRYRFSAALTTVGTAYFFLLDKVYFTSLLYLGVLVLCLLTISPANQLLAVDTVPGRAWLRGPWLLGLMRFQVGCVYVFAGIAKWTEDWLSGRTLSVMMPDYGPARWALGIAPARSVFAGFAWMGMLFDLAIVPLLCLPATRRAAFVALLIFHVHNAVVLPVELVPWFMLFASTVFLPPSWPRRLGLRLAAPAPANAAPGGHSRALRVFVGLWVVVQIALPLRRWASPGNPHFHEIGFPFTWSLRSRFKTSVAELLVVDRKTGQRERAPVGAGLSPSLAQRAAGDPFAIWWSAQEARRGRDVAVYADTWVSLNGSPASRLVDPDVDLAREPFPRSGIPRWVRREPTRGRVD